MKRKVPKGQKWIKLRTWAGEGDPRLLWDSFSGFQPQFSRHGAGNPQRGGRPWLLTSSHIMVLLGLRLGTHTSTFKHRLGPVPAHLNKYLRDKTPPRTRDQSPASTPPPPPPRCCAWGEKIPKILLTGHQGQLQPLHPVKATEERRSARLRKRASVVCRLSPSWCGSSSSRSSWTGRRLRRRAGTGGSLSITDGNLSGDHREYTWTAEWTSVNINTK